LHPEPVPLFKNCHAVSYRNINNAGIREDYSMGYPDEPGFRAGLARPFRFYNVAEEKMTDLRIFPFEVMDVTLAGYKKMNAGTAKEVISNLIMQTRKAGGQFISIWHNTSLLDTPECREWREVFEFHSERTGTLEFFKLDLLIISDLDHFPFFALDSPGTEFS